MSDNYYALMSESIYHDDVELIKYYARKISTFCKEHRCATCPFCINDSCNFFVHSPDGWQGIDNASKVAESCKELQKVATERPKGHWIRRPQGHYVCSLCEKGMYKSDFCPSCGADMKGGAEND